MNVNGDGFRHNHRDGMTTKPGRKPVPLHDAGGAAASFNNIRHALQGVPDFIVQRQLAHFYKADPRFGEGVADALGAKIAPEAIAAE
jgi:catalase